MAFVSTLLMVVIAEMGDKTQLIAMAFAAKFRVTQVLAGVLIGSLLNHGIAVLVGTYLGEVIPLHMVTLGAGALFVLFGLKALLPDKEDQDEGEKAAFGPVATVALSFFLGEMGDKTQLTSLTMAVEHHAPVLVLAGAVAGMMVANSPGVFVGDWLFRRTPPRALRLGSALVFLLFGLSTLYEALGPGAMTWATLAGCVALFAGIAWHVAAKTPRAAGPSRERNVA